MEHLKAIKRNRDAAIYELKGEHGDHLVRYIVSTPETRAICNTPEIAGVMYTDLLETAISSVLKNFPPASSIRKLDPQSVGVFHFLRGSLNFGVRRALTRAYGFNSHSSSFITSQRDRDKYGRWFIRDNQYRRIVLPYDGTLFCADVIATGVTVSNGLDILVNLAKNSGAPLKQLFFFTIGCHKLEKILKEYDKVLRGIFHQYQRTCAIYFEGKFHLADSKTEVRVKLQGTDLMRNPALLTPEFELSQYESLTAPLERCVIYDAGTRSCDIAEYMRRLEAYWEQIRGLAAQGLTLEEAIRERWPAEEYDLPFEEFSKEKARQWRGMSRAFLKKLYTAHHDRWTASFKRKARSPKALISLCDKRLRGISKVL